MTTYRLTINGMSCDHCARAVRSALEALPDIKASDVGMGTALVISDGSDASRTQIRHALEGAGYALTEMVPVDQ